MKKLVLFSFATLLVASTFTSCKKDYTCECSTTYNGVTTTASGTVNGTKSDAKEACEKGTSSAGGITVTCAIK